jgi:hypothetical protein
MIWDLPNLLVCLAVIFAARLLGKIKLAHALCLTLISFVPFCLNNVLFDAHYMPDQFLYWRILGAIRDFSYNSNYYNIRVSEASYMYAFLPLPFVETINSVGFFNKFLMICVFIWTAAVLKLRGWILWFLMLYPSLLLYSSLSLREMLICTLMLAALWTLMRGWYLFTVVFICLLVQVKMQNALIVVLFAVVYLVDKFTNISFTRKKFMAVLAAFLLLSYLAFPFIVAKVEYYRLRMFLEDGGLMADYHPITNFIDFLSLGLLGILRTLLAPLPWQCKGLFQRIQSGENIAVAALLLGFTWHAYRKIPKQTLLWLFFLLSGLFMYGLVVNNVGTIVRYKLPFIVVYLLLLSYEQVRVNDRSVRAQPYALNN